MAKNLNPVSVLIGFISFVALCSVLGLFGSPAFAKQPVATNTDLWLRNQLRDGKKLTIDPSIQKAAHDELQKGLAATHSKQGTVIVLEANTGAIKAMVNLPEGNLAMSPWEPGSVMKPLMMAAALNTGAITPDTTFFNTGKTKVEDRVIFNAIPEEPQATSMSDILAKSLNTGAIFLLKSLGGGDINQKSRTTWYDYLTNHYRFNTKTGVDIPNEGVGFVRPPSGGRYLDLRYASSAFGVGIAITPLQLISAYASIVNGGTYYQPHIDESAPQIISQNVISSKTNSQVRDMLKNALLLNNHEASKNTGYLLGGKTGTAPVAGTDSAYRLDVDNGTYIGFVGIKSPQYIVLVRMDEPKTTGFASTQAATVWTNIVKELINNGRVTQ